MNTADPLTEPTRARRVTAAMLKAGVTKSDLMKATGIAWSTIHAWSLERYQPKDEQLERVAPVLGFSAAELAIGSRPITGPLKELTGTERREVMRQLATVPDEQAAWGKHEASPEARYIEITREYMVAFVGRYREARKEGMTRDAATAVAGEAAINALAEALAIAEGRTPLPPLKR